MNIFEWLKENPQPTRAQGEWRQQVREVASDRLERIFADEKRLRNRVMTGDPDTESTAWTVPPIEEVQKRAAEMNGVVVTNFGDGSYRVDYEPNEEKQFITQAARKEFAGEDLRGIRWALETDLLGYADLSIAEERVGGLHEKYPGQDIAAIVAVRFWLALAHASYGTGFSSSSSYSHCETGFEIVRKLNQEKNGEDPLVIALYKETGRAMQSYD